MTYATGTGPAVLAPATVADVIAHLERILDGLHPGDPFAADHPDVQALRDSGQVPPQLIGSAFAALAAAHRIRPVAWDVMHTPGRNGGRALRWEVIA